MNKEQNMNTEQERAEFEAWRRKHYDYDDLDAFEIEFAWDAYKAGRAALQAEVEALMAAEERAEAERLRAAFENLANLRASDIKKEKDAFELWITSKHPGANLSPHQNNCGIMSSTDYMHPKVQAAWDAWQARAALQSQKADDALRDAIEQRDIAIDMLARWCVAVSENGAGWDDWDEHYKDAAYRPGPLRSLLDAAIHLISKESK